MKAQRIALAVVLAILLVTPLAAGAQAGKVARIGLIGPGRVDQAEVYVAVFRQRMRELGWIEGQHFVLEQRWAGGKTELFPDLARDLVRSNPDVIVAWTVPGVTAVKQATTTIPIVIGAAGDPVASGLITSLSRPGGNVTGVSQVQTEVSRKYPELLHELLPRLSHLGVLMDPTNSTDVRALPEIQETSRMLGLKLDAAEARSATEMDSAFARLKNNRVQAVIVMTNTVNWVFRARIIALAATSRLPALYSTNDFVKDGGLMSYAVDLLHDLSPRAANYVDKILKGAKPGDLPVEQPTKFELVINMRTAKALGLTIPPSLLLRADQTIE